MYSRTTLALSVDDLIFADVDLATTGIQDRGHRLAGATVGQGDSLQHRDRRQRLVQHLAEAFYGRESHSQASERARARDNDKAVYLRFVEIILLERFGDSRHQLRRVRAAFERG